MWGKVRAGLSKAVRAPWAAVGRVGDGIGWAASGTRTKATESGQAIRGRVAKVTEAPRARASSLRSRASEHPALAVGIVGGVLIGIAWIGWAIYVTTNNGVNAGVGVLITWPVLIGALALIAAPFVRTAMLVQRHRAASEPAMTGAPSIADEPAKKEEQKAKAETEDDSDQASEDEGESEQSEEPAAKSA